MAPHKQRQPVVAVMGHIDHGKSSLLDYIRKTNVVEKEAGGITQHLSAYEVEHATGGGVRALTFLDTPGHEAFEKMRERGARVADVAVLVVSAEEGAKPQTLEAYRAIAGAGIPFVVAFTKIDKPNADVERAKASLLENEIYLEGFGGTIPWAAISSKTGEGISALLDLILLAADLAGDAPDAAGEGSGWVIEAHVDPRRGISATLIVKRGTLRAGAFLVAGDAFAPTRIMQDFLGNPLSEAGPSRVARVIGWSKLPEIGSPFQVAATKREAEELAAAAPRPGPAAPLGNANEAGRLFIPIVIKADVAGSIEAVEHELKKVENERVGLKILARGVGAISEGDVKRASADENAIILGFNVKADARAHELAERLGIAVATFDIIYKLTEWLTEAIGKRTPMVEVEEVRGTAKILKTFSRTKDRQIVGGRIESGALTEGDVCALLRRGERLATVKVIGLQQQKAPAKRVESGEFGAELHSKLEVAPGDVLSSFVVVKK